MRKLSTHAACAAEIRKIIKKEFPGIPLCVRSESFAGGSAVRIYIGQRAKALNDGFTIDTQCPNHKLRQDVRFFIKQFEYGSFDGMTDSYDYTNVRDDIPQVKYVQISPYDNA